MKDLIDRNELIKSIRFHRNENDEIEGYVTSAKILEAKSLKLVKCRECDWWTKQQASLQGRCSRYGIYPTGAWFCASGEERDEENEE